MRHAAGPVIGIAATRRISRRRVAAAALTLGVAATRARAGTAPKPIATKAEAQYQDAPKGLLSCAACTFFVKPDRCKVVAGPVSPHGWCRFFDMVD